MNHPLPLETSRSENCRAGEAAGIGMLSAPATGCPCHEDTEINDLRAHLTGGVQQQEDDHGIDKGAQVSVSSITSVTSNDKMGNPP